MKFVCVVIVLGTTPGLTLAMEITSLTCMRRWLECCHKPGMRNSVLILASFKHFGHGLWQISQLLMCVSMLVLINITGTWRKAGFYIVVRAFTSENESMSLCCLSLSSYFCRFNFVRDRLKEELAQNPSSEMTINLVQGMSFVKVKMYPVEALEDWFRFLKELGNIYLMVRDKDVKNAFAAMFVEILGPVAAVSFMWLLCACIMVLKLLHKQ